MAYEAGGVPYSGEYHGPQGFFDLLAKMTEGMELTPGPDRSAVAALLAVRT